MAELDFPPISESPWTDPKGQIWFFDGDGWIRGISASTGISTGFKNIIMNGRFTILQRSNFNGNWATGTFWAYGYDRWQLDDESRIYQKIEADNLITDETYTLSWDNGSECEILQSTGDSIFTGFSPFTFVCPAVDSYLTFIFPHALLSNVQLERGGVATPYEILDPALELLRCQRYFNSIEVDVSASRKYGVNGNAYMSSVEIGYPKMRVNPGITLVGASYEGCVLRDIVSSQTRAAVRVDVTGSTYRIYGSDFKIELEADL